MDEEPAAIAGGRERHASSRNHAVHVGKVPVAARFHRFKQDQLRMQTRYRIADDYGGIEPFREDPP